MALISLRITDDQLASLDAMAERLDRDRSWLIRLAIDDLLVADATPNEDDLLPPASHPPGALGEAVAEGLVSSAPPPPPRKQRRERKRHRR